ncbi:DUF917 domain-containing protein [Paucibacter sp. DJ2R-2]|uniref:DUF917 domain-containing protein n=1 Tax=Paucibacter sp. DJ2R-2 TaxID=2893558 RepID=UPI0021E4A97F|nr:DUF917 domain-containing protein [Paucibacter sp. DJ2R-2]MCV2438601.1 DUF917 domain-containing protein [Paucibacter sp. DJ2R-2]
MTLIEAIDMEAIAIGGAVYGTGGGGDPYLGKLLAQRAIREHGPVRLIEIDELDDDDLIVPVAMAGAPAVMLEKLPEIGPMIAALRSLEALLGKKAKAVMSIEVGGLNSTIPFSIASATGLPLIDGDTMGRAFPEIQMTLCTLQGIAASPLALADEKGNTLTISTISNAFTERFVRSVTMDMGGSCCMAIYPMTAAQARKALVRGSITMTQRAGQALFDARARHLDPVAELVRVTEGFCLFKGKITDVQRTTDGRFGRGVAQLQGLDDNAGQRLQLQFQNEFLMARTDEAVLCTTPDLIVLVDLETGEPITAEQARFGLRAAVLGLPCVPAWRTPEAIALVGPRYFGYDHDYKPVEQTVMDR